MHEMDEQIKRETVDDFNVGHDPGRDLGLKAAFKVASRKRGWDRATRDEWAERFEAFRNEGAGQ